jgi:epoxyqueuosine reductase
MKQRIHNALRDFMAQCGGFPIGEDTAIDPSLAGLVPFDEPIMGVCDAQDEWFSAFQDEGVIGPHHMLPTDWLQTAMRVVSVYLPKSERVRQSNRGGQWPSAQWLHARYEGQQAINAMAAFLRDHLRALGYEAIAPCIDERFRVGHEGNRFTCNWSERHAAFACNLGTFSLSKGLITEKGVAGRLFSVVTSAPLPLDARQTREREASCARCGACIRACPVNAISFEGSKDHAKCAAFLDAVREKEDPRYGCGKCQTGVPCEAASPRR